MNKKLLILVCIISIVLFVVVKINGSSNESDTTKVIGDVEQVVDVTNYMKNIVSHNKKTNEKVKDVLKLSKLISLSKPLENSYEVWLVDKEGNSLDINCNEIEEGCMFCLEEELYYSHNGGQVVAKELGAISKIVVVSKDTTLENGFNIISNTKNIESFSLGKIMMSFINNDQKIYDKHIKPSYFYDINEDVSNIVMGNNGDYSLISSGDYFKLEEDCIDLMSEDNELKVYDAKGIYIDALQTSNMDVYKDTINYIEKGNKVMFVFLDGFSYGQYEYCKDNNLIPYMSQFDATMASSVYKPVTNAGFAAMITGVPPMKNGVYCRKQNELKTQSIFGKLKKMGKKSALIEADKKILNTEIQPILNIDKNKDGTIDDEIFECAKTKLKDDFDFLLVHFHAIDDMGHNFGDTGEQTLECIKIHDEYVRKLVESFEGKVIITSDHGMHKTKDGGSHGDFRYEDLIVPYIVVE